MTRGSKANKISTLVFTLLVIAAVVCYFAASGEVTFLYYGRTAAVLRLV